MFHGPVVLSGGEHRHDDGGSGPACLSLHENSGKKFTGNSCGSAPLTLFACLCFVNIPSAVILLVCVPLIPVSIAAARLVLPYRDERHGGER